MTKTGNTKISIENDPGASQERRKQCTFEFWWYFCVNCVSFHGAKHSPSTSYPLTDRRYKIQASTRICGTRRPNLTPSIEKKRKKENINQNSCLKHIAWDPERSLKSNKRILIWYFFKILLKMTSKWRRKHQKSRFHEKFWICSKSICEGPWRSKASKTMILRAF